MQTNPFIPADQPQRERIQKELETTFMVEAAAGTGKTTSMVARMVSLIREGKCRIHQLVAVTFTRKAAGELRARFQLDLEKEIQLREGEPQARLKQALEKMEQCFIGTIHSFCGGLLRERPLEAGIHLAFTELDDAGDMLLREEVWEEFTARLYAEGSPVLIQLTEAGLQIRQLKTAFLRFTDFPDVDEWPADAAELPDFSGLIPAIERYIVYMRDTAREFPEDTGTDPLMPKYRRIPRLANYYNINIPSQLMILADEFSGVSKVTQKCWPQGKEQALKEKEYWDLFIERYITPYKKQWYAYRYALVMQILKKAQTVYDQRRNALGALNFQDLLLKTAGLLREHSSVRHFFQRRYTHLLVDEFQDTDPVQAEIILYLTSAENHVTNWRDCRPVPGSLFVVGDPKQSIYRFRRADIVTYNLVKKIIIESGGSVLTLSANFRTQKPILDWVNRVFEPHFPVEATHYSPVYVPFQAGRPWQGSDKPSIDILEISEKKKEDILEEEAELIAHTIWHRTQNCGDKPGDFMIVSWKKDALSGYAAALKRYSIPHQVSGGSSLNQSHTLTLLRMVLDAVIHPEDAVALVAILRSEIFGFTDVDLYDFKQAGGRFTYLSTVPDGFSFTGEFQALFSRLKMYDHWMRNLPPIAALERIIDDLGLYALAAKEEGGNEETGCLAKCLEILRAAQSKIVTLADVITNLDDLIGNLAAYDSIPSKPYKESAVRIMNLHKVKGLEAPVVFLANPAGKSTHQSDIHINRTGDRTIGYMRITQLDAFQYRDLACPHCWTAIVEEEQKFQDAEFIRLLYVAATRAKFELIITQRSTFKGKNYWAFFEEHLKGFPRMTTPDSCRTQTAVPCLLLDSAACHDALQSIPENWKAVQIPSYMLQSVKSRLSEGRGDGESQGEFGSEWGTVIHQLLELSVKNPNLPIHPAAESLLEEHDLPLELLPEILHTVELVKSSDLWNRAMRSEQYYSEMSFQVLEQESEEPVPVLLRGVIDLVFKEKDGWVIVDYKTDAAAKTHPAKLIEKYRLQLEIYAREWSRITGQTMIEKGLYFTAIDEYKVL